MTNRRLRKALLERLKITHQALSQRVKRLKDDRPMTTPEAVYLIAHQNGIPLDKYLPQQEIESVRALLPATPGPSFDTPKTGVCTARKPVDECRTVVIGGEFRATDPILLPRVLGEAKEMAAVYPLLYVLENSMREAIDRVMKRKHDPKWWDTHAPKDLRDTVSKRMAQENIHSWHQRRGAGPLYYLDLNQLPALIRKNQADFVPDVVPSVEWFTQFVEEVYQSRCVLAHMNPLDKTNIQAVKVRFAQWRKLVNSKKAEL
jgi:hypothetical protein